VNPIRMLSHDGRSRIARTHFYSNREDAWAQIDNHYRDPHCWTSAITFTASWGRKPEGSCRKLFCESCG
jgi:hypothetical protein